MNRDEQLTQTTFFKYAFLNSLRDEVGLTLTFRKVTLLHLLCVVIPAAGLGAGSAWGTNLSQKIIGGLTGLVIGMAISWPLSKLFWKMLCLFLRKGWFLQLKLPESVPVMTSDEFIARSKTLRQGQRQCFLVWSLIFILGALGGARLCFYMDRSKPEMWIQVFAGFCILIFFAGWFFLQSCASKQIIRKCGLECPACGREITDASGLSHIPYMGLCRHCGTKVVEIKV